MCGKAYPTAVSPSTWQGEHEQRCVRPGVRAPDVVLKVFSRFHTAHLVSDHHLRDDLIRAVHKPHPARRYPDKAIVVAVHALKLNFGFLYQSIYRVEPLQLTEC